MLLHLKKISVVNNMLEHILHVVGMIRFRRNQGIQGSVRPINRVVTSFARRLFQIVGRHKTQQLANHREALGIILGGKVRHAGSLVVRHGPAELVFRHLFMRHQPNHIRPGNEHVRRMFHHQNEIRNRGRIHRSPGARPHNRRNLRHHPAIQRIAQKNIRIPRQRHHAFLNPRPTRIVQTNQRRAYLGRHVHDLDDLRRIRLRQRSAKHGKVLREHKHRPPIHLPVPGDEPIPLEGVLLHPKVSAAMGHKFVGLLERTLVQQEFNALARRHLAFFMLLFQPSQPATLIGQLAAPLKFRQFLFKFHSGTIIAGAATRDL